MSVSERRITHFPGNTSITPTPGNSTPVLGKRPPDQNPQLSRRFSTSNLTLPRVPTYHRGQPPAQIRLPVNTNSQHYAASARIAKAAADLFVKEGSPWSEYYAILTEDQDGKVTIAHDHKIHHRIVAIRQQPVQESQRLKQPIRCAHINLVELTGIFQDESSIYFAYEWIDVSVAEVQSAPCGKFASYHIAAICKEVSSELEELGSSRY